MEPQRCTTCNTPTHGLLTCSDCERSVYWPMREDHYRQMKELARLEREALFVTFSQARPDIYSLELTPRFTEGMCDRALGILHELGRVVWAIWPTGSRFICPQFASPGADYDVLVPHVDAFDNWLVDHGMADHDDIEENSGGGLGISTKDPSGDLNIISFLGEMRYKLDAWKAATVYCAMDPVRFKLRETRVRLFEKAEAERWTL